MVGKPGDLAIFDGIDRRPIVTPPFRLIPLLTQRLALLSIGVNIGRRFTPMRAYSCDGPPHPKRHRRLGQLARKRSEGIRNQEPKIGGRDGPTKKSPALKTGTQRSRRVDVDDAN
jgi:hypothetical protein